MTSVLQRCQGQETQKRSGTPYLDQSKLKTHDKSLQPEVLDQEERFSLVVKVRNGTTGEI